MLTGVALKLASTFAFACMGALAKAMASALPISQIVFFRSLFALVALVIWLRWVGEFPRAIHTRRPFGHLLRGIVGTGGMGGFFLGLALLPLPDATAIGYMTPLLVVVIAALFLGEHVRAYRWSAVAAGFVGVIVMVSDHLGEGAGSTFGVLAALFGASCASLATIQTRRLTQTETTGAIVFYFSMLTTSLSFLLMTAGLLWPLAAPLGAFFADQLWRAPSWGQFGILCAIGLAGGAGQIMLTESYRYADASVIAPFDYASMIWAVALGYMFFGEIPSMRIVVGATVVTLAGLYLIWREHRLGLARPERRASGVGRTT